jgi:hypothetical protein
MPATGFLKKVQDAANDSGEQLVQFILGSEALCEGVWEVKVFDEKSISRLSLSTNLLGLQKQFTNYGFKLCHSNKKEFPRSWHHPEFSPTSDWTAIKSKVKPQNKRKRTAGRESEVQKKRMTSADAKSNMQKKDRIDEVAPLALCAAAHGDDDDSGCSEIDNDINDDQVDRDADDEYEAGKEQHSDNGNCYHDDQQNNQQFDASDNTEATVNAQQADGSSDDDVMARDSSSSDKQGIDSEMNDMDIATTSNDHNASGGSIKPATAASTASVAPISAVQSPAVPKLDEHLLLLRKAMISRTADAKAAAAAAASTAAAEVAAAVDVAAAAATADADTGATTVAAAAVQAVEQDFLAFTTANSRTQQLLAARTKHAGIVKAAAAAAVQALAAETAQLAVVDQKLASITAERLVVAERVAAAKAAADAAAAAELQALELIEVIKRAADAEADVIRHMNGIAYSKAATNLIGLQHYL